MEVTVSVRDLRGDCPAPSLGVSHCLLAVSHQLILQGEQSHKGTVTRQWDSEGQCRGSLLQAISILVCRFVNSDDLLVFVSTFVELKKKPKKQKN